MKASTFNLAAAGLPGFWKRSIAELGRLSNAAIYLEGHRKPQSDLQLWNFAHPSSVDMCVDMSDSDIGGYSSSKLTHVAANGAEPGHALFSGSISNKLPRDEGDVQRTGYAAFRTQARPPTIFGKSLWNVDRYDYLALRIKSDGRKYKVNVQTESLVYSDLHQHRLYARRPGQWETVLINWRDFVRTNHGIVVEPQSEMLREKLQTIGVGLTDRLAGPFEMRIAQIWATNSQTPAELEDEESKADDVRYVPKRGLERDSAQGGSG